MQVEPAKEFAVERGLPYLVLGARIPFYHQHADLDVEGYVRKRNENGERFDPELRFYERCELTVEKILRGNMSGTWADPESLEYGVLMVWRIPIEKPRGA